MNLSLTEEALLKNKIKNLEHQVGYLSQCINELNGHVIRLADVVGGILDAQ